MYYPCWVLLCVYFPCWVLLCKLYWLHYPKNLTNLSSACALPLVGACLSNVVRNQVSHSCALSLTSSREFSLCVAMMMSQGVHGVVTWVVVVVQDGELAAELLLHMYRGTSSKDLLIMLSELQVRAASFVSSFLERSSSPGRFSWVWAPNRA